MSLNSNLKKKKVLIISHAAGNSLLGPNARWARFSKGLNRNNIKLTIVGASFFHKYISLIKSSFAKPKKSIVDNANFIHIWTPGYGNIFLRFLNQIVFSFSLFFLTKKDYGNEKFDIVIASSPHPFVVLGSLYWAKRFKSTFVFESRDLWPMLLKDHLKMSSYNPYLLLTSLMERIAVKKSKFIITPKEFEINYYKDNYNFKEVYWVPNTSPKKYIEKQNLTNNSNLSIVYSGSLQSIYLVNEIIMALDLINYKNLNLKIIGDGPDFEKLFKLSKGDSRINFLGWIKGKEYENILKNSDICYFSTKIMRINKYGYSSNKISDYLSYGKPILAHVSEGANNLIKSGSAIQSFPGDINGLAENIKKFLKDPGLLKKMSNFAINYYANTYEYKTVIDKLSKILNDNNKN